MRKTAWISRVGALCAVGVLLLSASARAQNTMVGEVGGQPNGGIAAPIAPGSQWGGSQWSAPQATSMWGGQQQMWGNNAWGTQTAAPEWGPSPYALAPTAGYSNFYGPVAEGGVFPRTGPAFNWVAAPGGNAQPGTPYYEHTHGGNAVNVGNYGSATGPIYFGSRPTGLTPAEPAYLYPYVYTTAQVSPNYGSTNQGRWSPAMSNYGAPYYGAPNFGAPNYSQPNSGTGTYGGYYSTAAPMTPFTPGFHR